MCKVRDESPIYVAKAQEGPELRLRFRFTEAFDCGGVLSVVKKCRRSW